MSAERFAAFVASGDARSLRFPYMPLEMRHGMPAILRMLGQLTERTKAQFLLACIRHAWESNVTSNQVRPEDRYDVGSRVPEETFAMLDDLLEGRHRSLDEIHIRLEAFQETFDEIKQAANANVAGAVLAANVTYVTGVLASWLYHALVAASEQPALTWLGYCGDTDRWLPFWLVLDGTASTGGEEERDWQCTALEGFANPVEERDIMNPAWMARTYELGPTLMQLWVSPWDAKRALIASTPDLLDVSRSQFTKLVVLKSLADDPEGHDAFAITIDAHELLLQWCKAAVTDAEETGIDTTLALDAVFSNGPLRAAVELQEN